MDTVKKPSYYEQSHQPNHDFCNVHLDGSWWFDFNEPCEHPGWHEAV